MATDFDGDFSIDAPQGATISVSYIGYETEERTAAADLNIVLKEEAGVTFVEYLTNVRMDKAREMLRNPEISVKDIGSAVGYQDANYFSRIFKRLEGRTPTEYRGENS